MISTRPVSGSPRSIRPPRLGLIMLACCALCLGGFACKDSSSTGSSSKKLQDFVPPGTESLVADGPLATYSTVAELASSVINGFNAKYDHGFVEMVIQNYVGGSGSLAGASATLFISEYSSEANVTIVFDELFNQGGTWTPLSGYDTDVYEFPSFGVYSILFRLGVYITELQILNYGSASEDAQTALKSFASHILIEMGD